jgi:hypothetical protein
VIRLRLALDRRGRADRTGARCGRRAALGRRALDFRAAGTRARRALARILFAGGGVNDDRLLLGDAALQHVLAEIRHRGALGLQHILAEVGRGAARRDGRLQNILAHIGLRTRRAHELVDLVACLFLVVLLLTTVGIFTTVGLLIALFRTGAERGRLLAHVARGDRRLEPLTHDYA